MLGNVLKNCSDTDDIFESGRLRKFKAVLIVSLLLLADRFGDISLLFKILLCRDESYRQVFSMRILFNNFHPVIESIEAFLTIDGVAENYHI